MPTNSLSAASLRNVISLVEKREKLQLELSKVEQDIQSKLAGGPVKKATVAPKTKKVGKGRRGAMKEKILAALQAAGSKGLGVKELSTQLGVKNQNLHVWFATTGKTIKGLKKTGPGLFTLAS